MRIALACNMRRHTRQRSIKVSLIAGIPAVNCRAVRALAVRAGVALGALNALYTLRTLFALYTLRTGIALGACRALRAGIALGPGKP